MADLSDLDRHCRDDGGDALVRHPLAGAGRYRRQYPLCPGQGLAGGAGLVRPAPISARSAGRGEYPLVAAGGYAARRTDAVLPCLRRSGHGRSAGLRGRPLAAAVAADAQPRLHRAAAGGAEWLVAGRTGAARRANGLWHVCADADRPSWLAIGAGADHAGRGDRHQPAARRHHGWGQQRAVDRDRHGDDRLSGGGRRVDRATLGISRRGRAADAALCAQPRRRDLALLSGLRQHGQPRTGLRRALADLGGGVRRGVGGHGAAGARPLARLDRPTGRRRDRGRRGGIVLLAQLAPMPQPLSDFARTGAAVARQHPRGQADHRAGPVDGGAVTGDPARRAHRAALGLVGCAARR